MDGYPSEIIQVSIDYYRLLWLVYLFLSMDYMLYKYLDMYLYINIH